ncbi:MAG: DUF2914 domain-containing protein [Thiohalomonadales bacterium]
MSNKLFHALLGSVVTLSSIHYTITVKAAQGNPTTPAADISQVTQTPQNDTNAITAPTENQHTTAYATPPIGFIAEGLGEAIAVAETEIVLLNQYKPQITRALFTHGVKQLEPIDTIVSISQTYGKMYFFTEFSNFKGEMVKHRWEHAGKIVAEVEFEVGSPNWRVYSSKNISTAGLGRWNVIVLDANGEELFSNSIMVVN